MLFNFLNFGSFLWEIGNAVIFSELWPEVKVELVEKELESYG